MSHRSLWHSFLSQKCPMPLMMSRGCGIGEHSCAQVEQLGERDDLTNSDLHIEVNLPRGPRARGSGSPRMPAGPTEHRRLATICVQNPRSLFPREAFVGFPIGQPELRALGPCELLGVPEARMKRNMRIHKLPAEVLDDSDLPVVFVEHVLQEFGNRVDVECLAKQLPRG